MATANDDGLNLKNLLTVLAPVTDKYYIIGIQLGISKDVLKSIEKDYGEAVRRLSEVLSYWLDENVEGATVSWDSLISALDSPHVKNNKLVTVLRQEYSKSTATLTQDSAYGTQESQLSATIESTDSVNLPSQSTATAVSLPAVDPLFNLTEGDDPESMLDELIVKEFGPTSLQFRPGQKEAIINVLSGTSTLVVLPVGSGKSLCYQLPAYLYFKRSSYITLVISPLISLMEDQIQNLPHFLKGSGACLHHNQTEAEQNDILQDIEKKKISVLLLTPEALEGGSLWSGRSTPCSLRRLPKVAFACIDEVHCVSEWSHNFRPSYLRIQRVLQERLRVHCILGLTATATPMTISDVTEHFDIDQANVITKGSILPAHLNISVSCEENKDKALIRLLKRNPNFKGQKSMIIYCSQCKETKRVAGLLNKEFPPVLREIAIPESDTSDSEDSSSEEQENNIFAKRSKSSSSSSKKRRVLVQTADFYHSHVEASDRYQVQKQFTEGSLRIVVATIAFGMGLNIPDIGGIIHYDIPKSFESFVQEIGRAGRGGEPAYCHIFIDKNKNDVYELRHHAYTDTVDSSTLKILIDHIFPPCQSKCPKPIRSQQTPPTSSPDSTHSLPTLSSPRCCKGHEVLIPIEELSKSLDIHEKCIATFLCYLEQQEWLKIISIFNDTCTLQWSGGKKQLRALMQKSRAVVEAVKLVGKGTDFGTMTFSMMKIAKSIGEEFHSVRSELSNLANSQPETGVWSIDRVSVEFSGRAYYIQSLGDFSRKEYEHIKEHLYGRMEMQEKRQLEKLYIIHAVLCSQSLTSPFESDSDAMTESSDDDDDEERPDLRTMAQQYFSEQGLNRACLETDFKIPIWPETEKVTGRQKRVVSNDVQSLVAYVPDYNFTGKSASRIFHGIASPRFSHLWGFNNGQFWKIHLDINFDNLCKIANEKLRSM